MPKVTIIVPVYNVEQYVSRCLKSLTSQTFTDLEVLLIDDASSDSSVSIITESIGAYTGDITFRLLRQSVNQGMSAARNRGMQEAKGEYLYFLDSDDYITKDCIEVLYAAIKEDPSVQMVMGNYRVVGRSNLAPFTLQQRTYTSSEIIGEQLRFSIYSMAWNKLISKSFLVRNHLLFQPGLVHEDNLWSFCCAFCFDKIAVVQKQTYIYVIHQGSVARSHDRQWHQQHLFEVFKHLLWFIFKSDAPSKKDVRNDKRVYRYMEDDMTSLVMEPLKDSYRDISFQRYREIREQPFWSFREIMMFRRLSLRRKWYYLHFMLPVDQGYKLYTWQHRKYRKSMDIYRNSISVIVIASNNLSGLKRTLPSIISQTHTDYELIVIDGGSSDGSKEYLQSVDRIDYWGSESDNSIHSMMDEAVKEAHGDYCIFMNAGDTLSSSQVLENVIGELKGADIYSGSSTFADGQSIVTQCPPEESSQHCLLQNSFIHQATFYRTEFLREHSCQEGVAYVDAVF